MSGGVTRIVLGVLALFVGLAALIPAPAVGGLFLLVAIVLLVWGYFARKEDLKAAAIRGRVAAQQAAQHQMQLAQAAEAERLARVRAQQAAHAQQVSRTQQPQPAAGTHPTVVVNLPQQAPTPVFMKCSHCGAIGNMLLGKCQGCGAPYF